MENKTIADFEEEDGFNIEEIMNQYYGYVDAILRNCMSNRQDCEEVLEDVFVILWKNYERLEKDMAVKPYLVGIAKNLVRKKYRKMPIQNIAENRENYEEKIADYVDIQELMEQSEKSKIVQQTIENMKSEEQKIFVMFYYQSKKIKEISKKLKISETKVKVTLHRLRKLVRKKLKERGYDYGKS